MHRPRQDLDPQLTRICGVDGCKYGWFSLRCAENFSNIEWRLARSWTELEISGETIVAVDMPVGLAASGKRGCDQAARKHPHIRPSSVFAIPVRGALDLDTYAEANAWSKENDHGGVVIQAWCLKPRILDLERALVERPSARIYESHPELAFAHLAGRKLPRKHDPDGLTERLALLHANGVTGLPDILNAVPRKHAKPDDILDAAVLLISARRIAAGHAQTYGDAALASTLARPMTITV
jgi:predicted RNase H-like nuclease